MLFRSGLFSAYDVVVVPTAPTLTATGGPAVNLSWTAPMDNGGAPVTGYTVSRSAGGAPAVVATVNGLTYTDATAVRGTTYSYTVKALNSAGSSPASNAASAVTFTVPDAPVLTVAASGKDAALSWSVADNGGSPITGYQVLRGTAAGAEVALTTTTATSLLDTGLAAGSTYYYQVVATNAAGSSAPSTEVSFSNATLPDAPVVTATGGVNKISLSWPAPYDGGAPISGYVLSRGTSSGVQAEFARLGAATSYVDTAVTPGTTYYYRLQAINSVGSSMNSAETFATAITTAGAPTLSAISGRNQVALSWTVPTSGGSAITGYQIYRGLAAGTETLIQTISNGTSYVDATVTGGTPYSYRVAAVTTAGAGALSNAVSVTPRRGK